MLMAAHFILLFFLGLDLRSGILFSVRNICPWLDSCV